MRVLGIDPGSRTTGFGIVDELKGGKLKLVESGEISCKAVLPMEERLLIISKGLNSLIERHSPEVVSIESLFHGKDTKALIQLSQARGVALLAAGAAGLKVYEYAPKTVKSAVTGYGSATKVQVREMVKRLLSIGGGAGGKGGPLIGEAGTVTGGEDASDALGIAICHIHSKPEKMKRLLESSPESGGAGGAGGSGKRSASL